MSAAFDRAVEYPGTDVIEVDCYSRNDWLIWWHWNKYTHADRLARALSYTRENGVWEPLTKRYFPSNQIAWDETSLRESGATEGINSRLRAVLYAYHSCLGDLNVYNTKIYAAEAVTPFALLLRSRFTKFVGSEYTSNPTVVEEMFPIPNEDLMRLSFKTGTFDLVTTNEVLEHVPDIDAALAEMARVLKPGGWHIGTCPFRFIDQVSEVRTKLDGDRLVHLLPPEWHGDPMGTGGSLVFETPGWDILDRAETAGFRRAFWKFIQSPNFGILSEGPGGVFVLCLQK